MTDEYELDNELDDIDVEDFEDDDGDDELDEDFIDDDYIGFYSDREAKADDLLADDEDDLDEDGDDYYADDENDPLLNDINEDNEVARHLNKNNINPDAE